MTSIGVRQLKEQASQILRHVREEGASYEVTYHGRVVARLVPVNQPEVADDEMAAVWADIDQLAAEIGKTWPDDVSAVEAVSEGRREL
jgi:prevent-host-death family protein